MAANSLELVKETSIAATVALPELLRSAGVAQEHTYNPTPLMVAALIYGDPAAAADAATGGAVAP